MLKRSSRSRCADTSKTNEQMRLPENGLLKKSKPPNSIGDDECHMHQRYEMGEMSATELHNCEVHLKVCCNRNAKAATFGGVIGVVGKLEICSRKVTGEMGVRCLWL